MFILLEDDIWINTNQIVQVKGTRNEDRYGEVVMSDGQKLKINLTEYKNLQQAMLRENGKDK